jgi:hypothetical protein
VTPPVLRQWRCAALVLIGLAGVLSASDGGERWWGTLVEAGKLLAFTLLLGGPVVIVCSLLGGLMPTRTPVRILLDLTAATWTAWSVWLLLGFSDLSPRGPAPRGEWLLGAGGTAVLLMGGWWLEDRLASHRVNRRTSARDRRAA